MASAPMEDTVYVTCIPWNNEQSANRCLEKDNAAWDGKVISMTQELYNQLFDTHLTYNFDGENYISHIITTWPDSCKKKLYRMLYNSGIRIN